MIYRLHVTICHYMVTTVTTVATGFVGKPQDLLMDTEESPWHV